LTILDANRKLAHSFQHIIVPEKGQALIMKLISDLLSISASDLSCLDRIIAILV
jgi:hypothetical protein